MRVSTALVLAVLVSTAAGAQETMTVGGDVYAADSSVTAAAPSPRDLFLSGASVEVGGEVTADAHVAGFDVDVDAPVGGDLYAGGFSVDVAAPVGTDLTAMAANFTLRPTAGVSGNARILAGNATLDGAIAGSLLAASGTIELNGTVTGDAVLTAGKLSFGPAARVGGTLTYYAQAPIEIPARVAAPERVRFEKLEPSKAYDRIRDAMDSPARAFWPTVISIFGAFVMTIAFLVLVGALALAFAPRATEQLRADAAARPFTAILLGALGLAMLLGLVPVSGMTLFAIPLIPIVVLAIVLAWVAGYALGVYVIAVRVAAGLGADLGGIGARLVALAVGLVVFALLNFVPFLGWLANLLVIFLGLGAFMLRGAAIVADRRAVPAPPQASAAS